MTPSVLLWDFGDTLADERWMLTAPTACPDWEKAWLAVMADLAEDWNVGAATAPQVFAALADITGMTAAAVEDHAKACCRHIVFHPTAWDVARQRRLPQALVTVNPDLFADVVVAAHRLQDVFDVIVVSGSEGTADKSELCIRALDRLGFDGDRSAALLIDNRDDVITAWRNVGGAGYWFRGDAAFSRDVPALLGE